MEESNPRPPSIYLQTTGVQSDGQLDSRRYDLIGCAISCSVVIAKTKCLPSNDDALLMKMAKKEEQGSGSKLFNSSLLPRIH